MGLASKAAGYNPHAQQPMYAPPGAPPPGQAPYGAPPGQYAPPSAPPMGAPNPYAAQQPGGYPPQGGYAPPGVAPPGQPGAYGQPPAPYGAPAGYAPPGQRPGGQPPYGAPPGQPYAQPPTGGYAGGGAQQKLQTTVQVKQLQSFYDPQRLQVLASKVATVDFNAIAAKWKLPTEMAYDLAAISLYDVVLYVDDSGSMAFEEGGERIDDLKFIIQCVAEICTGFDEDGISVRFMNNQLQGNNIRTPQDVQNLISQVRFSGLTPLGTSLDSKILQPLVVGPARANQLPKPVLIIAVTDGEPAGEPPETLRRVISTAHQAVSQTRYGPGAFSLEIGQVGKDQKAQKFLAGVDNDPVIGSMVDTTSNYELEADECLRKGVNLTPEMWLVKLLCGAVDPTYDEAD
ncbi:hypothetical protein HDV00_001273 [Rhizophlyctis rosea]|nr:hypothetical protein HDV00_001273 [Rhizophlyctis rosea]